MISDDILEEVEAGLAWALKDPNVYYFSIKYQDKLVGQIYLHDIDWGSAEGMIGYHFFRKMYHGKGIGTKALQLLLQFCEQESRLSKLVIITGAHNWASRKIAEKSGFSYVGVAREYSGNVVYEIR